MGPSYRAASRSYNERILSLSGLLMAEVYECLHVAVSAISIVGGEDNIHSQ